MSSRTSQTSSPFNKRSEEDTPYIIKQSVTWSNLISWHGLGLTCTNKLCFSGQVCSSEITKPFYEVFPCFHNLNFIDEIFVFLFAFESCFLFLGGCRLSGVQKDG